MEKTGEATADEVAQLYIHQQSASASRPVRELKGFERITLPAGKSASLHMSLGKQELSYWSTSKKDWVAESATFDVWIGGNSDASLHSAFVITAQ